MNNKYLKSGLFVMLLITLGKLLAFIKDVLIASYFGTSIETDAFFIAFNISSIFFIAFFSTVNLVFLPQYNDTLKIYGKKYTNIFVNNVFNIYLIITLFLMTNLIVFSDQLVYLIDSVANTYKHELTVKLLQIMSLSFIFSIAISFFNSIQLSNEKFLFPQLVTLINNFIVIIFIVLFSNNFGIISVAIGGVFAWIIQFPLHFYLVKEKFKYFFILTFKEKRTKKMFFIFFPAFLGIMVDQLNIMVDTILASGLEEGSISCLNYASRITNVFNGIFTLSVISIVYPLFSKYVTTNDSKNLKASLNKSIKLIILILTPIVTIIFVYSEEIISILFQRGKFDENSLNITSKVFLFYSISIVFWGLREIFNKVFYAKSNTKTPLYLSIFTVTINVLLSLSLIKSFSVAGLALATSISIIMCVFIQIYLLKNLIFKNETINFLNFIFKILLGNLFAYGIMYYIKNFLILNSLLVNILLGIIIGCLVYLITLWILKIEEVKFFIKK